MLLKEFGQGEGARRWRCWDKIRVTLEQHSQILREVGVLYDSTLQQVDLRRARPRLGEEVVHRDTYFFVQSFYDLQCLVY